MTGFDMGDVDRNLVALWAKVKPACVEALVETVEVVLNQSDRDAPRLSGSLVNSSTGKVDAGRLIGGVGYSDPKAPVAHENPRGKRYKRGKKAKFLETAVNDNANVLVNKAAAALRRALQ